MVLRRGMNRWHKRLLVAVAAFAIVGYFAWHAFHGNYGMPARDRLEARVVELRAELAEVQAERVAAQRRVSLLKSESLDPDILEERARTALSLAHPNDVVILQRPVDPPPTQQRTVPTERRR